MTRPSVLEFCAGGGGQAVGLEAAGFQHAAAIEIDAHACATLRANRPRWDVLQQDVREINGSEYAGIDLLAAGVPCPPFSIAGKQLGKDDERDLFPVALDLVEKARPKAVLLENVPGLASSKFEGYRRNVLQRLDALGYSTDWKIINACDFGVPQLRPRFILVAMRHDLFERFEWPTPRKKRTTVSETIGDIVASRGWKGAEAWSEKANGIAPTIVGGSKKHGGPDLGPTRARQQWAALGVDGIALANEPPGADHPIDVMPRLTVQMVARVQGFPDSWEFIGKKTHAYRQVGNAFPPPVAEAVGRAIRLALDVQSTAKNTKRRGLQTSLPL